MKHQYLRLLILWLISASPLLAQQRVVPSRSTRTPYETFALRNRIATAEPIICYYSNQNAFTRIGPPPGFNDPRARRAKTATFLVDYINYPDSARAAFQRAVDIWSTLLISPVPIRIRATWGPLAAGVLGSARPVNYVGAPDGSQRATAFYPMALAEKISRREINATTSPDIIASFSSTNNWYLGLDGASASGRFDLVTVVLHELGHGLGFVGGITGNLDTRQAVVQLPTVFDTYIENNLGTAILNQSLADPAALFGQLTGRNLFLNAPILRTVLGERAKLHAPVTYSPGSTLYHLDETTYRAGTPNALMTPILAPAEVAQNPGPAVLAFFEDMEWKTTSLLHESPFDTESDILVPFVARVVSDTVLGAAPPKFFYRTGLPTATNNTYKSADMVRQGTTQTYTYTLPPAEAQGTIAYYIQTQDGTGRTYTNPGKNNTGTVQLFHAFTTGIDRVPPRIVHTPKVVALLESAVDTAALEVLAQVTDDRQIINTAKTKVGIDTVLLEYQVNGQARPAVPMVLQRTSNFPDSTWRAVLPLAPASVRAGTVLTYRIVARDLSAARNQAISPATGFYTITVVGAQTTVRSQYSNDFNAVNAAADFLANGFKIEQPASFSSASINSEHPYKDGSGQNNQSNYTYTLLAPIKLKTNPDSARITFDEVVLVEPGEPGSTYLEPERFFDFVIVEGSKDNGRTWQPLINGYDSNSRPEWLAAWNASPSAPGPFGETNALTPGTPSLVFNRTIGMQTSGSFRPDDVILIRFRLFADQLSHGWGWQVDNLKIQIAPPAPLVLGLEPLPMSQFQVYPNPASGVVRVVAELTKPAQSGVLTLTGPSGQTLRQVPVTVRGGTQITEQLDLSQLPTGLYFLQLSAGEARQVKKIMVTR